MTYRSLAVFVALALSATSQPAFARSSIPTKIGECARTRIVEMSHRLGDAEIGSGSALRFADGLSQVSYDELPEVGLSRVGDAVLICLDFIPKNCPKGDDRGKTYTTTNLRTVQSWTLADSEHSCGGA